jgi:hypothetical protein
MCGDDRSVSREKESAVQSDFATPKAAKAMFWVGCVVSALPVLALTMSGVFKLTKPPEVVEGVAKLGWSENLLLTLAIIELGCTVVYVIPWTSVLGAILLTGYLGGATATHVRVGDPWYSPVIVGALVWLGLFLRDSRVRALVPLRR